MRPSGILFKKPVPFLCTDKNDSTGLYKHASRLLTGLGLSDPLEPSVLCDQGPRGPRRNARCCAPAGTAVRLQRGRRSESRRHDLLRGSLARQITQGTRLPQLLLRRIERRAQACALDLARGEPPLQLDDLPLTESLADTRERVRTFWLDELQPTVLEGKTVLVVGHANCLRALISCIQTNIRDEDLPSLGVPNALPLVYSFDESGRPLSELEGKCYIPPMDAHYLGDSCYVFNALSGAGELPPEADNNGDGVVDFNEYMSWESRLRAARPGVGVGRGDGGGGSSASRIRG